MRQDERARVPITKVPLPSEWAEFGNDFERDLVARLATERSILRPGRGDDRLSQKESEAFLSGRTEFEYAYQFVMEETPQLRSVLKLPDTVSIKRSVADLVRAEKNEQGQTIFTIIDIKATQVATLFHRAQVAFYSLVLRAWIKNLGINASVSDAGEIWHLKPGSGSASEGREEMPFLVRTYEHLVLDFFHNKLPLIAAQRVGPGLDETFFHIYFKCEQCEYVDHCSRSIASDLPPTQRDISAVAGMSHEAKRALQRRKIVNVGELARAGGLRSMPEMPWSVRGRADRLIARAQALEENKINGYPERITYLMPPRVDVGLFLVVDQDPIEGRIAALGYMCQRGTTRKHLIRTVDQGTPDQELDCLKEILSAAIADLSEVDQHNRTVPENEGLHAHIFLYEPSEARNLQEAIGRHLADTAIRTGLLHMIRIFPPEETLPEPEYKGHHHLPATALRSVVEQLYAVPVTVAYDLRQVTQALATADTPLLQPYEPDPDFRSRFSSRLPMEICRKLRDGRIDPERVRADIKARLDASGALMRWLLERNSEAVSPFLRLQKKPFQFQGHFDPLAPNDLDVLQAHEILEDRAAMMQTLVDLALPADERSERLRCFANMQLRKINRSGWSRTMVFGLQGESVGAELNPGDMGLILTNDDPNVRLNPQLWSRYEAALLPPDPGDPANVIRISVKNSIFDAVDFQRLLAKRGPWFLDKSYVDVNSPRVMNFLAFLAK